MHGFSHQILIAWETAAKPTNRERLRSWFPYSLHSMGIFSIKFSSFVFPIIFPNFVICEMHVFPHIFPISFKMPWKVNFMLSHQSSSCSMRFWQKYTFAVLCGLKVCECANFSTAFFSERLYEDFKLIAVSNHRLDSINTVVNFPNMANKNILEI